MPRRSPLRCDECRRSLAKTEASYSGGKACRKCPESATCVLSDFCNSLPWYAGTCLGSVPFVTVRRGLKNHEGTHCSCWTERRGNFSPSGTACLFQSFVGYISPEACLTFNRVFSLVLRYRGAIMAKSHNIFQKRSLNSLKKRFIFPIISQGRRLGTFI